MDARAADLKEELAQERSGLRDGLERAGASVGAADRERLRWVLACDRAELWRRDGCRNMAQWLSGTAGISNWKARRWVAAAYALEELVHVAAALERGSLSLDKTVELTRFATPATEKKLISWARRVTVARVREKADEATRRSLEEVLDAHEERFLRWWWYPEGERVAFEGMLSAEQGAVWIEALDRVARDLPKAPGGEHAAPAEDRPEDGEPSLEQRRADALLLTTTQAGEQRALDRTELVLHAPLASLADDEGNCSFGGRMLHPETARRLTCDARLQVVLEGESGAPLGVGHATQITPRWLRRQVFYRDGYTCTFPGCEAKQFLTPHHIRHWIRRGPTELDNLVTLCSFHHARARARLERDARLRRLCGVAAPRRGRYEPGPAPPEGAPPAPVSRRALLAEAAAYSTLFDLLELCSARPAASVA